MIVCNDSKEISSLQNKLKDYADKLNKLSDAMQLELTTLYRYTIDNERSIRQQNPYIVKAVIKYMANGLNKSDAMLLVAKDFQTDIARVQAVYWSQNRYMSAVNLYAKRYTCEKLKKSGYTAKQIASVIGVSENHIFKLLKANPDFWFLK